MSDEGLKIGRRLFLCSPAVLLLPDPLRDHAASLIPYPGGPCCHLSTSVRASTIRRH